MRTLLIAVVLAGGLVSAPGAGVGRAAPGAQSGDVRARSTSTVYGDASGATRAAVLFSGPSLPDGTRAEYAVNADGSGLKRLPVSGSLSPNGKWVAFVRCRANCIKSETGLSVDDLYVSTVDGSHVRRVGTWNTPEVVGRVSWAPDSRRLAYGEELGAWVRIVDTRTGRVVRQIEGAESPEWSPNGRLLAVLGRRGGLYTVRPDGSNWHRIANVFESSWSPDSAWLAVEEDDVLYRVSEDGSRKRQVVRDTDLPGTTPFPEVRAPEWSPRGGWIAFAGTSGGGNWAAYVVRPDGSGLRAVLALGQFGWSNKLAWSPDGRGLATMVTSARHSTSVVISDVFVVDVAQGKSRRVTQGRRYGSENIPVQWHPLGWSTQRISGAAATWPLPSDTVGASTTAKTTRVIDRLAADGAPAAYTFVPPTFTGYHGRDRFRSSPTNCGESWQPGTPVLRVRAPCSGTPWGPQGIAVSGDRLAWVETLLGSMAGSNSVSVYTGTLAAPALSSLLQTGNNPAGDLVGDGGLLLFATWRNDGCTGAGCYAGPRRDSKLYRFDGRETLRIASSSGPLTPLSVDAGRIVVDRGGRLLDLMAADGTSLRTFQLNPAIVRGARLQGRDLVVQTTSAVEVTNADTGSFLRRWPLPAENAQLVDVQDGVAVLVAGSDFHLLRLADGPGTVIKAPGTGVLAQLESSGLFYAYRTDDPKYPGRVVFVPFDNLPLR